MYGAAGGSRRLNGGRGDGHGGSQIRNKRRSMFERINEEKEDINLQISGQLDVPSPTIRLADFDHLSVYKRHHRPRPIIPRSSSTPNLIDILLSDHPISLNQPHPHPPPLPSPPPQKSQQSRSSGKNGMASLLPRNDSFGARTRGASHIDFRTATTGVIGKAMRNELSQLVNTVQDSQTRKAGSVSTIYSTNIDLSVGLRHRNAVLFLSLHPLSCRACSGSGIVNPPFSCHHLDTTLTFFNRDWERIKSPGHDQIVPYSSLSKPKDSSALSKLAVLKVNGGLGTSMGMHLPLLVEVLRLKLKLSAGMTGAKSALEVKDDMTFLDLTVRQIEHLNTTERIDVPLILMTSFNTHEDTLRIIKKYANQQLRITTFNQSRYPRIFKETLLPCPKLADDDKKNWYPPGHGDLYNALLHSGVLDQLIAQGKEYLFVSNSDNLGAVYVHPRDPPTFLSSSSRSAESTRASYNT